MVIQTKPLIAKASIPLPMSARGKQDPKKHSLFLYERVDTSNILSRFVVGRPRPEYGLPVAVI